MSCDLDVFWKCVFVGRHTVWMGVGCPCPPVRSKIVTPRHLLSGVRIKIVEVFVEYARNGACKQLNKVPFDKGQSV